MKKVLITGGSGFIGRAMIRYFLKTTDWDLVILDRLSYATNINALIQEKDINKNLNRIKFLYHDLRAPIEGEIVNQIGSIDYIINSASDSHVDRSISNPAPFIQNNVSLAINMLEYARLIKPKIFIQVSTDEIYGPALEGISHKEWDSTIPSNPYAASKASQEAIAISYWRTYGVPVVITNTMNNFGEDQHDEKFIPMVVKKIINKEKISIHGSFEQKTGNFISGSRVWLHATNHADAIKHIIENVEIKEYPQDDRPLKIHIAGEKEVSNLEIVNLVSNILTIEAKILPIDFHSSRAGHDLRYSLDGSLLRKTLAWKSPKDFDQTFKETILSLANQYKK